MPSWLGLGVRHAEMGKEGAESPLVSHVFERREIGQRHSEIRGQALARGGKEIGLLVSREQHVDVAAPHYVKDGR